jgi:hypothetical protein
MRSGIPCDASVPSFLPSVSIVEDELECLGCEICGTCFEVEPEPSGIAGASTASQRRDH